MTKSFVEQVVEFNQRVLKIEQRPVGMLSQAEFEITMKSLQEELDEFEEAYKNGDMIGCIDALIDLRYFAVGALYKQGLSAQTISSCDVAVHDANMEKKLGVVEKRATDGAADAVKPEGWIAPEMRIIEILDRVCPDEKDIGAAA